MNSMQLKDKIRNLSKEKNIDFNLLLRNYMYERFIERLYCSKYKDNFILKGGYYLSLYFGIDFRYTMDIDFCLKSETLSQENIGKLIKEIIKIDVNDNAIITFDDINKIREEDIYGGYRVKLTVQIEKIKETFNIDIATGDPITPRELNFKYMTMLDYKYIDLSSYNLETVLAEKLETILSKKDLSSRTKDYYDIYLIYTFSKDKIDVDILKKALYKTFKKRGFNEDIQEAFNIIKNSEILRIRWKSYSRKNKYANDISYKDIIKCLEELIKILELVAI